MNKAGWSSILVAALVLAFGVAAKAQQPKNIPHIGYIASTAPDTPNNLAFRRGLQDLGYIEGKIFSLKIATLREKRTVSQALWPS